MSKPYYTPEEKAERNREANRKQSRKKSREGQDIGDLPMATTDDDRQAEGVTDGQQK